MTRRTLNPDGTFTLKSFSYFGPEEHAAEAFRHEMAGIDEHNRKALAEWHGLTLEEQQRRTHEFMAWEREFRSPAVQWEALPAPSPNVQGEIPTFL